MMKFRIVKLANGKYNFVVKRNWYTGWTKYSLDGEDEFDTPEKAESVFDVILSQNEEVMRQFTFYVVKEFTLKEKLNEINQNCKKPDNERKVIHIGEKFKHKGS